MNITGTEQALAALEGFVGDTEDTAEELGNLLEEHQDPPRPDESFDAETYGAVREAEQAIRQAMRLSLQAIKKLR